MKKKTFAFLVCLVLSVVCFASCKDTACTHKDSDFDGVCDQCSANYTKENASGICTHTDIDGDQKCDECGADYIGKSDDNTASGDSLLEFVLQGDSTYAVVGIGTCTDTDIVIPQEHKGLPVTSIKKGAFDNQSGLISVTIPSSITSVDSYAFAGCRSLTIYCEAVSQPLGWDNSWSSGTWEGYSYTKTPVVWNCKNNEIADDGFIYVLVDGIRYAFKNGEAIVAKQPQNIVSASIPGSVYYKSATYNVVGIDKYAFRECKNLLSLTIDNGIERIREEAFYGCTSLISAAMPDSVVSIDASAFSGCTLLVSVTVGAGTTSIESFAFRDCYRLVEIINKSDLNIIAGSSNYGEIGQYAINVHNGVSGMADRDGCLFLTYRSNHYLVGYTGHAEELVLPPNYNGEGYTIYRNAFKDNGTLRRVVVGEGATSIGDEAFYNCIALTNVTISANVESVGASAFSGCSSLKTVAFDEKSKLSDIGKSSFTGCASLVDIVIPDNVHKIGTYAFSGCSALTDVTIPNCVKIIEAYAFADCAGLTIYCQTASQPAEWNQDWIDWSFYSVTVCPVVCHQILFSNVECCLRLRHLVYNLVKCIYCIHHLVVLSCNE